MSAQASTRAPVNLCPYCGEEDLRPAVPQAVEGPGRDRPVGDAWHCRSCLRLFSVAYHGMVRP